MPRRSRLRDPREAALHDTEWQARIDEVLAQLATRPWFGHWPVAYVDSPYGEFPHGSWTVVAAWPGLSGDDTLSGGEGNDSMFGAGGADWLSGLGGNDLLLGGQGDDALDGGSGDDRLRGGRGNDTVVGGAGNDELLGGTGDDTLVGGEGSDTYRFGRGGGHDTIDNNDADSETHDVLRLGSAIRLDDLSFQHVGDELVISIFGTEDVITVTGWFADPNNRLDGIHLASGDVLTANQIEALVSTMAAFSTPHSHQLLTLEPAAGLATRVLLADISVGAVPS